MALSRISCSRDLPAILTRLNHGANVALSSVPNTSKTVDPKILNVTRSPSFHVSAVKKYPDAPALPLPGNVSEIFSNETGRFTPERSRDINTPMLLYGSNNRKSWGGAWTSSGTFGDSHVDSYDCFGAVNLNSSMQTNVPKPFNSTGRATHMNMPGGSWLQNGKYIAEYMQKSHYLYVKRGGINRKLCGNGSTTARYSTNATKVDEKLDSDVKLSNAEKLKRAVKDYGSTVVVFHVTISLLSLGACYALISSGLDITSMIKMLPISNERIETIMTGSSTFVVAYAVHKIFAPARISITLGATPFIVRYLRTVGILKAPKT